MGYAAIYSSIVVIFPASSFMMFLPVALVPHTEVLMVRCLIDINIPYVNKIPESERIDQTISQATEMFLFTGCMFSVETVHCRCFAANHQQDL